MEAPITSYKSDKPPCWKTDPYNLSHSSKADPAKIADPTYIKQQKRMKNLEDNYTRQHNSLLKLTEAADLF